MKYSAVILAFVAAVAAQSAAELAAAIPACAKPSLDKAAGSVGCDVTDYACQCGPKKQELTVAASPEVVTACGTEAAAVLEATNALCAFVEANPDAAGGESSSAAAETTASPSQTSSSDASATDSASDAESSVSSGASSVAAGVTGVSSTPAAATSAVAPNAAGMNAVNVGAMLGAAGVVAAMI